MALSEMGGIRRKFMSSHLRSTNSFSDALPPELEENVIEWTTLFRRNWDIYAELFLEIPLKPFQRAALHEIGNSDVFFWRAGRGGSKSFVTAIAAMCKLLLYPNCWIVITAQTVDQANKIVEDKIQNELINKISKYLLYLYEKQWIIITKPNDGYLVKNTLNNSILRVVSPVDSARGIRSNFTIYDETAIMKKEAIDNIFDGMLFPRQPNYIINNPKYMGNPRWLEESKAIYLTSSKFKWMWWYKTWKDCVNGYYIDKETKYNVFASDFFDNIDNGLKTWGDYRRAKRTTADMAFRMEYLNEAIGENEDAFFSLKSFKDNQCIERAFVPPKPMDIYIQKDLGNVLKGENEVRFVIADFAFANTTSATKNDNTIIMCMSLHWKRNRFERHIDYIEIWPASDSLGAGQRVRELKWLYDADYVIND